MRILVSTGHLDECLAKFDFKQESVTHCKIESDLLTFYSQTKKVEVNCVAESESDWIWQYSRRWDWVSDHVSKIFDCPVVIDITKEELKLIFDF